MGVPKLDTGVDVYDNKVKKNQHHTTNKKPNISFYFILFLMLCFVLTICIIVPFLCPCSFDNSVILCVLACSCNTVGSVGTNCHNITSQCTCKPNVVGFSCATCAVNAYNFTSGLGCTLCNCNVQGSSLLQCLNVCIGSFSFLVSVTF